MVLATKLDVLHKSHHIIEHPYFSRHVRELIYVEGHYEPDDDDKYNSAFQDVDCEQMEDEDKLLWQDLSRYSDYPHRGPERFRGADKSVFDHHSLLYPDFEDYITAIRTNMLEKLLNTLTKLRHVILTDFRSGQVEGLTGSTLESETYEEIDISQCSAYGEGHDFTRLMYLVGQIRGSGLKSIAVGPHLFENSMAYWEKRRDKNVLVGAARASYHLSLAAMDELWDDCHDEVKSVMRVLRRLHLPIVVGKFDTAALLETSLPSLVELAAPTLTHLTLDAKGLIQDGTPRDGLGLLGFEAFFGKLHMPHLVQFDLRGWAYTQDQLQRFLVRHAGPLRELRLMHNVMLEGDLISLADFGCDKLSLVGIELGGGAEWEKTLEGVKIRDGVTPNLSKPEWWLEPQWQTHSFALELRWLGGRSNQIVRARPLRYDQYMSRSALE